MSSSKAYMPTRQSSSASMMKAEILSSTKDATGSSRQVTRTQSIMSDLPPTYEDAMGKPVPSPSYSASAPNMGAQQIYIPPPGGDPSTAPVIDVRSFNHTCLEKNPLRNVPLIGLVNVALFPLSCVYRGVSNHYQCNQCGAGLGRQLTGLAVEKARQKIQQKQMKRAARRC